MASLEQAYAELEGDGHMYESEGATWLRTTSFGDDKDRVLRRSDGALTYFAPDIAYHGNKRDRGFDRLIDVFGADHHGYVAREKAGFEAIGGDRERFEILIMQLVNLLESGQRAQMSKRAGTIVTLDELIDDIGVDAARFDICTRCPLSNRLTSCMRMTSNCSGSPPSASQAALIRAT